MSDEETNTSEPEVNLEDAFQGLFKTSVSGGGEEELLRIASTFAMQLTSRQMKALLYLEWMLPKLNADAKDRVQRFIDSYLRWKQNNNSDMFVMKALEHISLRKFIGENSVKVNIEK